MTATRDAVMERLWKKVDPFAGFPAELYPVDTQGWRSGHRYLVEGVNSIRPGIAVEIGVWKGASVLTLAGRMKALGLDGVVIAVDTWLGSYEHWQNDEWFKSLGIQHGWPQLQRTFMANVLAAGLQDYVVPLPLDSSNAAVLLRRLGIAANLIHLDAGHSYDAVMSDLNRWWPRLREDGLFIGDDYVPSWPGVVAAFDEFVERHRLPALESVKGKCRIRKPAAPPEAAAPRRAGRVGRLLKIGKSWKRLLRRQRWNEGSAVFPQSRSGSNGVLRLS